MNSDQINLDINKTWLFINIQIKIITEKKKSGLIC